MPGVLPCLRVALALCCAACTGVAPALPSPPASAAERPAEPARDEPAPAEPATEAPPRPPERAIATLTDPDALAVIERATGAFATLVAAYGEPGATNAELARGSTAYQSLSAAIAAEVERVRRADPTAGVGIRGHAHRLFDVRWLSSPSARFELVGVVNRLDRRAVDSSGCGETRLVYRLAYDTEQAGTRLYSRLPLTVIAELRAEDPDAAGSCASAARRWLAPEALSGAALGRQLVSATGALAPSLVARERLVQLAVNVQTVRWPSGARPDLAGHAEYALRAFGWDGGEQRYVPRELENTPDVPRLLRDRDLRAELVAWISAPDNLARIDAGTALLPARFLADHAVSVTPRGFARLQNRPFRRLLRPEDFTGLELAGLRHARSPEALLRRLDDLTCNGCHQSRSIAGFHLLGEDPPATAPGNALAVALSPHAQRDQLRRIAYTRALAEGQEPDPVRPFAERAGPEDDGYGAHCGLGDPGFADWACAAGLRCDPYEAPAGDATVGVCLPERPRVGDPCQPGRVTPHPDPHRDRVRGFEPRPCEHVCEANRVGFPGGMCAARCADLPEDGACGGIAILTDFNNCLARRTPFADCIARHVRPAGLRACSAEAPCRDDYVCARTGSGQGACLPPYFVFQLRVDGHP